MPQDAFLGLFVPKTGKTKKAFSGQEGQNHLEKTGGACEYRGVPPAGVPKELSPFGTLAHVKKAVSYR